MSDRKTSENASKSPSSCSRKILKKMLANEEENKRLVDKLRPNFIAQRRKGIKLRVKVVEHQKRARKIRFNRRELHQKLSNIKDTVKSKSPEEIAVPMAEKLGPTVRLDKNLTDSLEKAGRDLESTEQKIEHWLHVNKEVEEDSICRSQESILLNEMNKRIQQILRDLMDDLAIFLASLPEELKRSVAGSDAIVSTAYEAVSISAEIFDDCPKLRQDYKSLEKLAIDLDQDLKQLVEKNEQSLQFLFSMRNHGSRKYFYGVENVVADNYCHSTPAIPFISAQENLASSLEKLYDWCRRELSKPSRFVEQLPVTSSSADISKRPTCSEVSTPTSPTVDWSIEKAWLVDMHLPVNDQLATIDKQLERVTTENKELLEKLAKIDKKATEKEPAIADSRTKRNNLKLKKAILALDKDSAQIYVMLPILKRKLMKKTEIIESTVDKINVARFKSRKYDEKFLIDKKTSEDELESINTKKRHLLEKIKDVNDSAAELPDLNNEIELLNRKITACREIINDSAQKQANMNVFADILNQTRITNDCAEDVGPFPSRKTTEWQHVKKKRGETEGKGESVYQDSISEKLDLTYDKLKINHTRRKIFYV